MNLIRDFFRDKPIILHKSEKLVILSMVCLVSLFLLVSGYTLVFETEFKEFTMLMTGIGFLIIGAFAPITTFTSFADYGIMKEEIQKLEAKKH